MGFCSNCQDRAWCRHWHYNLGPISYCCGQQVPRNPICQIAAGALLAAQRPKALVRAVACQGREASMYSTMEL